MYLAAFASCPRHAIASSSASPSSEDMTFCEDKQGEVRDAGFKVELWKSTCAKTLIDFEGTELETIQSENKDVKLLEQTVLK